MEILDSGNLSEEMLRYTELLGELQEIEEIFCNKNDGCHTCELNHLCVTIKRF